MSISKNKLLNLKKIGSTVIVITLLLICLSFLSFQNMNSQLEGDKKAIVLVKKMLYSIGGEKIWKEAKSIKVELIGYSAEEKHPWDETFWIDLNRAQGRFIIKSKTKNEEIAWTPKNGWHMTDGKVVPQDSARHSLEMEYWKRQSVVVFHRLATGIPKTKVKMGDNEFKFRVFDMKNNEFIAQFTVNKKGEPIKWSTKIGDHQLEHIFGPLKRFNNVSLPIWGTTSSGKWRYEHKSILLSDSLPPINYEPPRIN